MSPLTQEWVDKAEEDFQVAQREYRARKNPSEVHNNLWSKPNAPPEERLRSRERICPNHRLTEPRDIR